MDLSRVRALGDRLFVWQKIDDLDPELVKQGQKYVSEVLEKMA